MRLSPSDIEVVAKCVLELRKAQDIPEVVAAIFAACSFHWKEFDLPDPAIRLKEVQP